MHTVSVFRSCDQVGKYANTFFIGDLSIEGFTCMIIFKNMFSFGLTYKAYDWLVINGTRATPVFNALGAVQVVVCALSIPMCKSHTAEIAWPLLFY